MHWSATSSGDPQQAELSVREHNHVVLVSITPQPTDCQVSDFLWNTACRLNLLQFRVIRICDESAVGRPHR